MLYTAYKFLDKNKLTGIEFFIENKMLYFAVRNGRKMESARVTVEFLKDIYPARTEKEIDSTILPEMINKVKE